VFISRARGRRPPLKCQTDQGLRPRLTHSLLREPLRAPFSRRCRPARAERTVRDTRQAHRLPGQRWGLLPAASRGARDRTSGHVKKNHVKIFLNFVAGKPRLTVLTPGRALQSAPPPCFANVQKNLAFKKMPKRPVKGPVQRACPKGLSKGLARGPVNKGLAGGLATGLSKGPVQRACQ
jgi:hypothetical protein